MNEESQIQAVAAFYFFGLLDESKAKRASVKTVKQCQKRLKRSSLPIEEVPSVIVHCTNSNWETAKKASGHSSNAYEVGWILPESADLGSWRAFQNEADDDEFLAVLWSRILCFSDQQIARGLGVTEGTVRYRVGRGLRLLGQLIAPTESKA